MDSQVQNIPWGHVGLWHVAETRLPKHLIIIKKIDSKKTHGRNPQVLLPGKVCMGQLRQWALWNFTWNEGQDFHTMHQDVSSTNHPSHETDATPGIDDPDEFFFFSLEKPKSAQLFENDVFWIKITTYARRFLSCLNQFVKHFSSSHSLWLICRLIERERKRERPAWGRTPESVLKALVMNRELVPPVQASKLNKVIMAEALAETEFIISTFTENIKHCLYSIKNLIWMWFNKRRKKTHHEICFQRLEGKNPPTYRTITFIFMFTCSGLIPIYWKKKSFDNLMCSKMMQNILFL